MTLADYGLSAERGFLPHHDPLADLGSGFEAWEEAAQGLPKLLMTGRIRSLLERLPEFPLDRIADERAERRAMQILSYLGHAYVWGEEEPAPTLPARLAVPWHAIAQRQGRPPVLSYASYALDNWRKIDPEGPIRLGNIALLQNFLAGEDEEWFILIHIDIEDRAAQAIRACIPAVESSTAEELKAALTGIAEGVDGMNETMDRMPERCDPYIYFHRVRPYIHGWKNHPVLTEGLRYEGVSAYSGPQQFRGETGAQSSIVPCLDAALSVGHADDPLKEYLMEMRTYMPPKHRAFMEALESTGGVADRARDWGLTAEYDRCVEGVRAFRARHLEYAASYIHKQAQTDPGNPSQVGTGGTPFMKYLKKHRDETADHAIG